ncbi:gamma-glutamyltransferase [Bombella sp. ESL0385]|uniref:gamma-glutamyltransferase n=1 Tax=Bombella sp. ESL0385 TaxID=2676446 RepID=UPI0012D973D7|nr:gamma-glutamyltransferase [Bombella sp. ESL0385]MCT6855040.1 gamma-glutamyltransferase [Bombella apis]MUG90830.1 gamma-glutamyltransferase [Bombella sp. ESL0385]
MMAWRKRAMRLVIGALCVGMVPFCQAEPLSADHDPLAYGPDTTRPGLLVRGERGMVVSAQHLASEAGARILREGGNAADAAVAVGYALAVVYPAAGNLGGGGFMTLRPSHGPAVFIDFREHAPLRAQPDMYVDAAGHVKPGLSTIGWQAVAVPGTVAGLEAVRKRWGRLSRAQDMAPAIALARDGFVLEEGDVELLHTSTDYFRQDEYARGIFLRPDGSELAVGDRLIQPGLARSLALIAQQGDRAFYHGPIAAEILRVARLGGGLLTEADFHAYKPRFMEPIRCAYRGYQIETAPPPSGGGVALCEILNILSGYNMTQLGLHSAQAVRYEIEAMRHAYSDRRDLGDPAFVQNPVSYLTDPAYAAQIRAALPAHHAISSDALFVGQPGPSHVAHAGAEPAEEKHETTHFSTIDAQGMAVSTTYTLNGWFGAGVMGGRTGIWMNDEMDDFSIKPGEPNMFGLVGSAANAIAPGKTPLSSMSPTIISREGKVVMVTGSPGGSRIPTIVLSSLLGVVDYGLDLAQAVDLPRLHEQWKPDSVEMESGALSPEVQKTLEHMGYHFIAHRPWGITEAILVGGPRLGMQPSAKGIGPFYGVADPRHPGGGAVAP